MMARSGPVKRTGILLVDDHRLFREGLARLLNAEPDLEVKAHCESVGEALMVVALGLVDVVLLDVDLGPERGIDFLMQARKNGFTGPVLLLTAGVSEQEHAMCESYGLAGTLLKDSAPGELAARIREVVASPVPCQQTAAVKDAAARKLSTRELDVLQAVFEGLGNKEIGVQLGISEASVKAALQGLFRKTGTHSRSQLVRVALERHRDQL